MSQPCSTDYWHAMVTNQQKMLEYEMLLALKREVPHMCSVTMERACNLSCAHCIYPYGKSSYSLSREANLSSLVLEAIKQLPDPAPKLLHEGRILRPWHLDILSAARETKRSLKIGLIDNGSYITLVNEFLKRRFHLDWLDISIDGPPKIHNEQRRNAQAFRLAWEGLEMAREVTISRRSGGRVTALFTVTSINHASLKETADLLFSSSASSHLVDEFHITTISPIRKEIEVYEQNDLRMFWRQAQDVYREYGLDEDRKRRIFIRFYRHQELVKLAQVVGREKMKAAFKKRLLFAPGEVHFFLDEIPCIYSPLSLWPGETFLIDADGRNGTAHSISHSLVELRSGRTKDGADLSGYTIEMLRSGFSLIDLHHKCVDQWWQFKGKNYLEEEKSIFRSF